MADYDVIVAGLGGMGSAAAAHLAQRGARVLGIEQFARGHELGASSGKSRIIRKAYFESPEYVPLLQRAYELWLELEEKSQRQLYFRTGLLTVGTEHSEILARARQAAAKHSLDVSMIGAGDIRAKYPALAPLDTEAAVYEPDAGYVIPEATVEAHLAIAEQHGAELIFNAKISDWRSNARGVGVRVLTYGDAYFTAPRLVSALGPWSKGHFENAHVQLRIQRNVMAWFEPSVQLSSEEMPCYLIERAGFPSLLYGFPDAGEGVKAAFHGYGELTTPEELKREIDPALDIEPLATALNAFIPGAAHRFLQAKACMYSLTRDEHFVIDVHPDDSRVIIACGFSGHGFKFVPIVGEILAQLALDGSTQHDIEFLSARRFAT